MNPTTFQTQSGYSNHNTTESVFFSFFVFLTDSQKPSTVLRIRYQRWVTSKDVCKETGKVGSIQTPAQQVGSASQQMLSQAAQVKCWGRKESFV